MFEYNLQNERLFLSGIWKALLVLFSRSVMSNCDPMDCSTPGFPVLYLLLEFAQTPVHWVGDAIWTILCSAVPFSSCLQSLPASGSFPVSWLFASGGQGIGASASASVFPMNIHSWLLLGLTCLISLPSKVSQKSSPAPLKSISSSVLSLLYGPTHIHIGLLEKP